MICRSPLLSCGVFSLMLVLPSLACGQCQGGKQGSAGGRPGGGGRQGPGGGSTTAFRMPAPPTFNSMIPQRQTSFNPQNPLQQNQLQLQQGLQQQQLMQQALLVQQQQQFLQSLQAQAALQTDAVLQQAALNHPIQVVRSAAALELARRGQFGQLQNPLAGQTIP
jgi:hypothetical protein